MVHSKPGKSDRITDAPVHTVCCTISTER